MRRPRDLATVVDRIHKGYHDRWDRDAIFLSIWSAMSDESAADPSALRPELLCGMAAVVAVTLTAERSATLVPQAAQHFAQLRNLDAIADSSTEPAAELRLDQWTRSVSD